MLHFKTILLWIAFALLVSQSFASFDNYLLGLIYRQTPIGILLLWFLLSVFLKENHQIRKEKSSKFQYTLIQVLRPLANISIVLGAMLKIMHWPFGNLLLISGIGFMALYSTILSRISILKDDYNPEILDETDPDE
jgi:hypothetical protein